MTPDQQEKLFDAVRDRWPEWSDRAASGYVKGVVDGLRLDEPDKEQIHTLIAPSIPNASECAYAITYVRGFADAHGVVFSDWWYTFLIGADNSGPWWEHDEILAEA